MKKAHVVSMALALAVPVAGLAAVQPTAPNAPAVFSRLRSGLAGSWKLAGAVTSPRQEAFRISFKEISRGSALVETFGDPAASVTETIYHLDGEHLLATHYCAQGNQPRLRLVKDDPKAGVEFAFQDATNLPSEEASHLVRMRIRLDGDRLEKDEIYVANGKEDVTTLALVRVR